MENFVEAVRKAIKNKNWYGALFIALTLPDICGKIDNPRESSSQIRYSKWFEKYMEKYSGFLPGSDCYALRCALLHEGTNDITQQRASEILERFEFMTDGPHCNLSKNNYVNGKRIPTFLQLRVDKFCEDISIAVESWLHDVSSDQEIQERLSKTIEIHGLGHTYGGIKFG